MSDPPPPPPPPPAVEENGAGGQDGAGRRRKASRARRGSGLLRDMGPFPPPPPQAANEDVAIHWKTLLTSDGTPYYHNEVTGRTTWDKPVSLMEDSEASSTGRYVWVRHPEEAWAPAQVLQERAGGVLSVEHFDTGQRMEVGPADVGDPIFRISALKHVVKDMVHLDDVNEASILYNVRERFKKDLIYTNIGTILVSVNPFKAMDFLYTAESIEAHRTRSVGDEPEPHVFTIADAAFRGVRDELADQSVIISGESGAGKTEAVKKCLQYFAEVAGSGTGIEQKILSANPVLEGFGNAKTLRNNNSSRFGKFMEVHFNDRGEIEGCRTVNYLLEKSRVVVQTGGERNYHSFYMLCTGLPAALRDEFALGPPSDFHYLRQSGCTEIPDRPDDAEFADLSDAFLELGFADSEQQDVYRLCAAVLHLGNMEFEADESEGGDGSHPAPGPAIATAARLMGVAQQDLAHALTHRVLPSVRGQAPMHKLLSPAMAADARNALAKALYGRMFDWLVVRVNRAMDLDAAHRTHIIGVLDIFGFEIFENNSFEQLCINFCNEKLQQHFNQATFKTEQEVYEREGISFDAITFKDNQDVLDLIQRRPTGLLPMLDEEMKVPRGSDASYVKKVAQKHNDNSRFRARTARDVHLSETEFIVSHYAGDVGYDAHGFLEKNRDQLSDNLANLVAASTLPFLSTTLFGPDGSPSADDTAPTPTGSASPGRRGASAPRKRSLGAQFSAQLDSLMTKLNSTDPHYIRCIKPNAAKKADVFEGVMSLEQLRYSGVFEAVQIRKQGFPFRRSHEDFAKRFRALRPDVVPAEIMQGGQYKEACRRLCNALGAEELALRDLQFGTTMMLYRAEQHRALEVRRQRVVAKATGTCQRTVRGGTARARSRRMRAARDALRAAVSERSLESVAAALEQARSAGFETPLVREAETLYQRLVLEKRLREGLRAALAESAQAPVDAQPRLQAAVAEARSHDFGGEALDRAEARVARVETRIETQQGLEDAIARAGRDGLEESLAAVEALEGEWGGEFCRPLKEQARAVLKDMEEEERVMKALQKALASGARAASARQRASAGLAPQEGDAAAAATDPLSAASREALTEAERPARDFGAKTAFGRHLLYSAELVSALREAEHAEDWDALERVLGGVREDEVCPESKPEVEAARELLFQVRAASKLREGLARCAVAGRVGACRTEGVSPAPLDDGLRYARSHTLQDPTARALVHSCAVVHELRGYIAAGAWEAAADAVDREAAWLDARPTEIADEAREELLLICGEVRHRRTVRALAEALGADRVGGEVGAVDTSATRVEPLQEAIEAAERTGSAQSPRARSLLDGARVIVGLRRAAVEGQWREVGRLVAAASAAEQALPDEASPEMALCAAEADDRRTREELEEAMTRGQARGKPGAVEEGSIDVAPLEQALSAAERRGEARTREARQLIAATRALCKLRTALKVAAACPVNDHRAGPHHASPGGAATSAAGEAEATKALGEAVEEAREAALPDTAAGELRLASQEWDDRTCRAVLRDAMTRGGPSGAPGALDCGGVDVAGLEAAVRRASQLGAPTQAATRLLASARHLLNARKAAKADDWDQGVHAAVVAAEEEAGSDLSPLCRAELASLKEEAAHRTAVAALREALAFGAAAGEVGAVDTGEVAVAGLRGALARCRELSPSTEEAKLLMRTAELVLALREALAEGDWDAAEAPLRALATMAVPREARAEVALCDAEARNRTVVRGLVGALARGGADGQVGALRSGSLNVGSVAAAVARAAKEDSVLAPATQRLAEAAQHVMALRKAVQAGEWGARVREPLTALSAHVRDAEAAGLWDDSTAATAAEGAADGASHAALPPPLLPRAALREVRLCWHEVEDRRVCDALVTALARGRVTGRVGALATEAVSAKEAAQAVSECEQVAHEHGSLGARTHSLLHATRLVLQLREAVTADRWDAVVETLDSAAAAAAAAAASGKASAAATASPQAQASLARDGSSGTRRRAVLRHSLPAEAAEEVALVHEESDVRRACNAMRAALAEGAAVGACGEIRRDSIRVEPLAAALQTVEDLGVQAAEVARLQRTASRVMELREALAAADWPGLRKALEAGQADGSLSAPEAAEEAARAEDEVANATAVANLHQAMSRGGATGPVGAMDVSGVTVDAVGEAIDRTQCLRTRSQEASRLLNQATAVRALRVALTQDDLDAAGHAVSRVRQGDLRPDDPAWGEIQRAQHELDNRRILREVGAALQSGAIAGSPGALSLSALGYGRLDEALAAALQLEPRSDEARSIVRTGRAVRAVRAAAEGNDWEGVAAAMGDLVFATAPRLRAAGLPSGPTALPGQQQLTQDGEEAGAAATPATTVEKAATTPGVAVAPEKARAAHAAVDAVAKAVPRLRREHGALGVPVEEVVEAEAREELRVVRLELEHRFLVQQLREAMAEGGPQGRPGRLDVTNVATARLSAAVTAAAALVPRTAEARQALATAKAVLALRSALVAGEWSDVEAALGRAAEGDMEESAHAELQLVQWEADNLTVVAELEEALSEGGAAGAVGAVDVHVVQTEGLEDAVQHARAIGCRTPHAHALLRAAKVVLAMRRAMRAEDWSGVERALVAAQTLGDDLRHGVSDSASPSKEQARGTLTVPGSTAPSAPAALQGLGLPDAVRDELQLAQDEVDLRHVVSALTKGLSLGGPEGDLGALITASVDTLVLESAINLALRRGCKTPRARGLLRSARLVRDLRHALATDDWDAVGLLLQRAQQVELEDEAHAEVQRVQDEAEDREMVRDLGSAIASGAPSGTVGSLVVATVSVARLEQAIGRAQELGPKTERARRLMHTARLLRPLRSALAARDWGGVQDALEAVRGEDVVEEAREEVQLTSNEAANRKAVRQLIRALSSGRAAGSPGAIDVLPVRVDELDAAITGASEDRVATEEAKDLLDTARIIRRLRAAQQGGDWEAVRRELSAALEARGAISLDSPSDVAALEASGVGDEEEEEEEKEEEGKEGAESGDEEEEKEEEEGEEEKKAVAEVRVSRVLRELPRVAPAARDEVALARAELCDREVVHHLATAVGKGGLRGAVGDIDTSGVTIKELTRAIAFASRVGCQTQRGGQLLAAAPLLRRVRKRAVADDWDGVAHALPADGEDSMPDEARAELRLAREEVQDRALARELRAALAVGGPVGEVGSLDVYSIEVQRLDAALGEASARGGPRTADTRRLLRTCEAVRKVRCAMRQGGSWEVTREVVQSIDVDSLAPEALEEVRVVQAEVDNWSVCSELRAALAHGGAGGRVGELDTTTIALSALDAAIEHAATLGCRTVEARALLLTARALRQLRAALQVEDWEAAADVVRRLDDSAGGKQVETEEARREVALARRELDNRTVVSDLSLALASGMAVGLTGSLDLSLVSVHALDAAIEHAGSVDPETVEARQLLATARMVRRIRGALLQGDWSRVVALLTEAEGTHIADVAVPELRQLRDETVELDIEATLLSAVRAGGPGGDIGSLDLASIELIDLDTALTKCEALGPRTPRTQRLLSAARLVRALRAALLGQDWAQVAEILDRARRMGLLDEEGGHGSEEEDGEDGEKASPEAASPADEAGAEVEGGEEEGSGPSAWQRLRRSLGSARDLSAAESAVVRELTIARDELRNRTMLQLLQRALAENGPLGAVGAMNVQSIKVGPLDRAIMRVTAMGPRTPRARQLLASAHAIRQLRAALQAGSTVQVQQAVAEARSRQLDENARAEVQFAQDDLDNRLVIQELEEAVSTGGASGDPGALDLFSIVLGPLERAIARAHEVGCKTEEARHLLRSARLLRRLRSALQGGDWDGVREVVEDARRYPVAPQAAEEVERAGLELHNRTAVAELTRALREGSATSRTGELDTTSVDVGGLDAAIARTAQGKLCTVHSRQLLATAHVVRALRAAQQAGSMDGVRQALADAQQRTVASVAEEELERARHDAENDTIVRALRKALGSGQPRGGAGALDLGSVSVGVLDDAVVLARRLVCRTEEAQRLLRTVELVRNLRAALLQGDVVLLSTLVAHVRGRELAEEAGPELQLLEAEVAHREAAHCLEAAVSADAATPRPGSGLDVSTVSVARLEEALAGVRRVVGGVEWEDMPQRMRQLVYTGDMVRRLRLALLADDWAEVEEVVNEVREGDEAEAKGSDGAQGGSASADEGEEEEAADSGEAGQLARLEDGGRSMRLHAIARTELDAAHRELRIRTACRELRAALRTGAAQCKGGYVDVSTLSLDELDVVLPRARLSGKASADAQLLLRTGELVREMRAALRDGAWEDVQRALQAMEAVGVAPEATEEVAAVRREVSLREAMMETMGKLARAAESRDHDALRDAVHRAEALGMESNADLHVVSRVVRAKDALQQLEQCRARVSRAVEEVDVGELDRALAQAEALEFEGEEVKRGRALRDRLAALAEEADAALATLDTERIRAVLAEADEQGVRLSQAEAMRELLALPPQLLLQAQLRAAMERRDVEAVVRATVAFKTLFFETAGQSFDLLDAPTLRAPRDFAYGSAVTPEGMLEHQMVPLHLSLTQLSALHNSLALKTFRNVLGFMGDRQYSFPVTLAQEVLEIGLARPQLRDEVYCQIMKQLTRNPRADSINRGWQLLYLCLATFPPSEALENFVEAFIRHHQESSCLTQLHRRVYLGAVTRAPGLHDVEELGKQQFHTRNLRRWRAASDLGSTRKGAAGAANGVIGAEDRFE